MRAAKPGPASAALLERALKLRPRPTWNELQALLAAALRERESAQSYFTSALRYHDDIAWARRRLREAEAFVDAAERAMKERQVADTAKRMRRHT